MKWVTYGNGSHSIFLCTSQFLSDFIICVIETNQIACVTQHTIRHTLFTGFSINLNTRRALPGDCFFFTLYLPTFRTQKENIVILTEDWFKQDPTTANETRELYLVQSVFGMKKVDPISTCTETDH